MGECLPTRCRPYYRIQREPFTLGDAVAEGAAADAERVAADDAVPAVIDLVAVLIQGAEPAVLGEEVGMHHRLRPFADVRLLGELLRRAARKKVAHNRRRGCAQARILERVYQLLTPMNP
jgi:hypothetical protein